MKKKRLVLAILLMFTLAFTAFAQGGFAGEMISEDVDGSAFSAGQNAGSSADVNGILFAAGYNVTAGGSGEHALLAGYSVNLSGDYEKDIFAAGNSVNISGNVGRDVFASGNAVTITGNCAGNAYIAANSVVIDGKIGKNLYLSAEEITISNTADISGQLHYNADAKINAPAFVLSDALVTDPTYTQDTDETEKDNGITADGILSNLKGAAFGFIGLLLVAYILLWLTPVWNKVDAKYTSAPFSKYAKAFGIGLAVLICVPLASVILMITGVGLRTALLVLFLYAAAITASPVIFGFIIGSLILRRAFRLKPCYYFELALGLAIYKIISLIPVLSLICGIIAVPLGVGAFVLFLEKEKACKITETTAAKDAAATDENAAEQQ